MPGLGIFLLLNVLTHLGQIVQGSVIINGRRAPEGSMQYMVSVQSKGHHICGGFLISDDVVVTAAHCAEERKLDHVILGTHQLRSERRTQREIAQQCKHPQYKNLDVGMGHDIMLLKLAEKVPLGNGITTIPLPPPGVNQKDNEECTVAGWGKTETDPYGVDDLREVNVSIINPQTCKKEWRALPDNVICAGGFGTKNGFCQGDSGGPLLCNGELVGVVSYNRNEHCSYPDRPNVYTDVSRYLTWIKKGNQCFN